ncbi:UNVERIFIED_CONTAM: hypothetical protein FKN15_022113 [Acipenser sinensis]
MEILVDFVYLTSEAQLMGTRGHYPALKGALDAMGRVVDQIHRERWEAEQSQLACAGAPICSICMEYGHVEANCHDREEDADMDLEWEELEVQREAEELLSQEEEPRPCPEPSPRQFTGGDDPLMEELRPHSPKIFWGGRGRVVDDPQNQQEVLLR